MRLSRGNFATTRERTSSESLSKQLLFQSGQLIGAKIKDAKLLGIPYLVIIGNSYSGNNVYEVEERLTNAKLKLTFEQLCKIGTLKIDVK